MTTVCIRIGQQSGLGRELMKLWKACVDFYASPPPALQQQLSLHTVLSLGEPLNRLAARMNPAGRRSLACYFLTAALDSERSVRSTTELSLLSLCLELYEV